MDFREQRQCVHTFWDQASRDLETVTQTYLIWAGDYVWEDDGQPSSMDLVEVRKPETDLKFDFEVFERVLVLNLSRLFKRICVELADLGVKI